MTSSSNLKIEPQIRPLGYTLHSTALKRAVYTLSLPVGIHNRLRNEKKKEFGHNRKQSVSLSISPAFNFGFLKAADHNKT